MHKKYSPFYILIATIFLANILSSVFGANSSLDVDGEVPIQATNVVSQTGSDGTTFLFVSKQPPTIIQSDFSNLSSGSVWLNFETSEMTVPKIIYSSDKEFSNSRLINGQSFLKNHSYYINNLLPNTQYFFKIIITDTMANESTTYKDITTTPIASTINQPEDKPVKPLESKPTSQTKPVNQPTNNNQGRVVSGTQNQVTPIQKNSFEPNSQTTIIKPDETKNISTITPPNQTKKKAHASFLNDYYYNQPYKTIDYDYTLSYWIIFMTSGSGLLFGLLRFYRYFFKH